MSQDKSKETGLVSMHSEWVGKSYVRTVARRVGKSATLMVDVTEYADRPSKKRASAAARHAAREASATPVKAPAGSVIFEHESRQTDEQAGRRRKPRSAADSHADHYVRFRNLRFR